ncbi:MAG: hypothetical protein K1X75_05815 [Leptospirales bacterium]|nr:hypothetical protein [Leptospirales bacterium]
MKYLKMGGVAAAAVLLLAGACKKGQRIEEIGGHNVTTAEFEDHYSTAIETATRFGNSEKETLYKLICNPSLAPNESAADMAISLQPRYAYQRYRDMLMIESVAREEGFPDRPIVRKILENSNRLALVQLYLHEKVWEKIKITEAEKQQTCEDLRRREPQRVGPLSLDDCLKVAEGFLIRSQFERIQREVYEEIKERVRVEKNEEFDREAYFNTGVELYQQIKEGGGCRDQPPGAPGAAPSTPPGGLIPGAPGGPRVGP